MDWDNDNELVNYNIDPEDVRIETRMYSINYILDLIQDFNLNLSAEFNRHSIWSNKQKSLLIESLLLRIPIPSFYFYEDNEWKFHVIDGVQRLIACEEFFNNKFKLNNLVILSECNGFYYKELPAKYQYRILQTQIQVNVIDSRTPKEIRFEILKRLNMGGSSLTPQELRNTVAKWPVRDLLDELANLKLFEMTIGETSNKRFQSQEMILRFIAFYRSYDWEGRELYFYKGDINEFLNFHFSEINEMPHYNLELYKNAFIRGLENMNLLRISISTKDKKTNKNIYILLLVILSHLSRFDIANINEEKLYFKLEYFFKNSRSYNNSSRRSYYIYFEELRKILEVASYND